MRQIAKDDCSSRIASVPTVPRNTKALVNGRAVELIGRVCGLAGSMDFLTETAAGAREAGIDRAVAARDTPTIFDWLLTIFSFQGVSDQVARSYMQANGTASWAAMAAYFEAQPHPSCGRLRSYWRFADCRYDKTSFSCSEPDHIHSCLVPRPRLRNGRLNQTAAIRLGKER